MPPRAPILFRGVVRPQPISVMAPVVPDEFALYANGRARSGLVGAGPVETPPPGMGSQCPTYLFQ